MHRDDDDDEDASGRYDKLSLKFIFNPQANLSHFQFKVCFVYSKKYLIAGLNSYVRKISSTAVSHFV